MLNALCLLTCLTGASAQGTRQWTVSHYEEFERGTPTGIAMRNDGRLEPAPALRVVSTTPAAFLWSIAVAPGGGLYAGSGSASGGSQLLRLDAKGASTVAAQFKELNVQALLPMADGSVLAATSPDGKVYRVAATGAPEVVFDAAATAEKPKYLWALALAKDGELLVAAGSPATIYKVPLRGAAAKPAPWFRSGDQHIRSLLVTPDGSVLAGSDGAGIVYRIAPDRKPFALYAAPKHEITALAMDPAGNVYAAAVGDRRSPALPPLSIAGGAAPAGALGAALGALVLSAPPISTAAAGAGTLVPDGSEIYRIAPDGTPVRLVALREDVVYALAWRNGALFAGSGNRGRVYRMAGNEPGTFTDVAHTETSQVTAMAATPGGLALATANSGKVLMLSDVTASAATYISDVFDGGTATAWGRAEVLGSTAGVDLFVRGGNIENPRDGLAHLWSGWAAVKPGQTPLPVPATRYLQWKAVLRPNTTLRQVTVNYLPRNLPPQVDDVVVQPGARVSGNQGAPAVSSTVSIVFRAAPSPASQAVVESGGSGPLIAQKDRTAVTARWSAHDPDNDALLYTLEFRDVHETAWHPLAGNLRGTSYSFDSSLLPDGEYEMRVTASDGPVHTDADTLTGSRISPPFTVDTTPPVPGSLTATVRDGKLHATFEATDATSPIAHAEYSVDAGPWEYMEPVGHLSDSLTERYELTLPVTGSETHVIAVRVFDREENAVSVKASARP